MMRIFKIISSAIIIFFAVVIVSVVFANPFASDNFNSYADGDLNTNNGGTGWSGAWGAGGTCNLGVDVQGTTVFEGAKAISWATNGDLCTRDFANITSDIVHVAIRRSNNTDANAKLIINIRDADLAQGWQISMTNSVIQIEGATTANCGGGSSWSINTWYEVHLSFDTTGAGTGKCRVDTADWGSSVEEINAITNINRLRLECASSQSCFQDDVKTGSNLAVAAADETKNVIFFGTNF